MYVGTGIDMSPLFTAQAQSRAVELGVAGQVGFVHGDAPRHRHPRIPGLGRVRAHGALRLATALKKQVLLA